MVEFIKLMEDRILVETIEPPKESPGGVLLAEAYQKPAWQGIVINVGPGRIVPKTGIRIPCELKPGDIVFFSRYEGSETLRYNGKEYLFLRESTGIFGYLTRDKVEINVMEILSKGGLN